MPVARCTPGKAAMAFKKRWSRCMASAPLLDLAVRAYRSAGSTTSSHWVTEPRKLVTITVRATDRLRLATTPAVATVAVWRMRRARSTDSIRAAWRASGARGHRLSRAPTAEGTQAMPPTSKATTAR